MAPRDQGGLSLRWEFVPATEDRTRAVYWRWYAYTQAGRLYAESASPFETLSECIADARRHGYAPPAG